MQSIIIDNTLSAHVYFENLILFNGFFTDRLWWLNLSTFIWHEESCSNIFPPPTRFHASVVSGSRFYVCGGKPIRFDSSFTTPTNLQHDFLDIFFMNLQDLKWEIVSCDWKPRARSHHTLTAVGKISLIVIGGKPLKDEITSYEIQEMMINEFYAVHVFDIKSGIWRVFSQRSFPCLWGHSTHLLNSDAVVIFGGFETTLEVDENGEEIPSLTLSNYLWFINYKTMECYRATTRVPGRVLHQSHIRGDYLCILGGLSVDELQLNLVSQRDAIEISLISYEYLPMKFCLQHWPLESLVSVVYNQQIILLNKSEDIFVQRMNSDGLWERYHCDVRKIYTSPFSNLSLDVSTLRKNSKEKSEREVNNSQLVNFDISISKPSISPILWTMLSHLGYPLEEMGKESVLDLTK